MFFATFESTQNQSHALQNIINESFAVLTVFVDNIIDYMYTYTYIKWKLYASTFCLVSLELLLLLNSVELFADDTNEIGSIRRHVFYLKLTHMSVATKYFTPHPNRISI